MGNVILGTLKLHSRTDRMGFNNILLCPVSPLHPSLGRETLQAHCPCAAPPAVQTPEVQVLRTCIPFSWKRMDGWMDGCQPQTTFEFADDKTSETRFPLYSGANRCPPKSSHLKTFEFLPAFDPRLILLKSIKLH